jgi:hypothetical protein
MSHEELQGELEATIDRNDWAGVATVNFVGVLAPRANATALYS